MKVIFRGCAVMIIYGAVLLGNISFHRAFFWLLLTVVVVVFDNGLHSNVFEQA